MWRSKKLIIGAVVAAVLLAGSLGGMALADTGDDSADTGDDGKLGACREALLNNVCDYLNGLEGMVIEITPEQLEAAFANARSQMPDECQRPKRPGGQGAGISECLVDKFGIDLDVWKAAMAEARERIQAGEDRQEVMAEVLASFGIDIEELKATCTGDADGERPFKRGFRGMGGMRGFGGPCGSAE